MTGNAVKRMSTVGHTKHRAVKETELAKSSPSGKSDVDPK
jgi:hypothetical protein